jgi:energy-coupling factor transport system ATP-binding protein
LTEPIGAQELINLRGARYAYPGTSRPVLAGVDLTIHLGEVLGLVGPNDAGKTTLCLVAAGLAPQAIGGTLEGEVTVAGHPTTSLRPHELAQRIGILFQNAATQLSGTAPTVWEEVAFGPRNLGLSLGDVVDRVWWALDLLRLGNLAERDPLRLSGGQAQLVALASVLALRPSALILDEPTSQLDPVGTRLVGEALTNLAAETQTAILIVEHKTDLLLAMAHRIAVMDEGRIVQSGPANEVLGDAELGSRGVEPPSPVRVARLLEEAGLDGQALAR